MAMIESDADKPRKPSPASQARRQFMLDSARMACGVGLLGLGIGLYAKQAKALPPLALRPLIQPPEIQFR